ncbi:Peroxisome biosynthesis protein pex1 [Thoreauomyces humboldtii]|nr:Peroxisome biosynthesis protein pex1 [Thoreauomyces humboldtii]
MSTRGKNTGKARMGEQRGLGFAGFATVRETKLLVKPVTVTKGESIVLGKNKEDSAIVVQAMQEFLGRITFHSGHTLLTTETIHEVPLKLSSGTTTNVQITVLPEKGNVAKSAMPLCARIDAVAVETITIEMGASVTVKDTSQEAREPVPRLAGVDALMQQLHFEMKTRIAWPMIRKAMGAPAPGGILLYGSRGSGKTSIVKAAAHALSLDWETLAHSVFVDCADLASERPIRVKDILQDAVYKAIWQFPCILVLDDLDRMIPAEQEHTDSSRSRQLTEIFIELMNRARQSFGLVILATCQQRTSVHAALLTQHLFGEILHITPPGKPQRQQLLEIMLQSTKLTTYSPASLDLSSVAGTTEGYSPADLYTLTQRAVHGAAIRHVDDRLHGRQIARESEMRVEGEDYVKAQEGFVPANLKNVKLEKGGGVAWSDVGGLRQTKRTLLETLEWPTKYAAIFANCALRLRSGLLLYGFPGCGKTLLASAVAKECGLNFISVKGPELLNKYIGASEQSVRDLFERASAAKPCILFFDEFDAIAPRRGNDNTGVTDRVVNQMLTQMDGAEGLDGVYVLAATSRPDIIDPALLRPGRLDKSLLCGMPDEAERLEILQAVSTKLSLEPSVSLASYAARTEGFSGADLQALLYNAHLEAIHHVIDAAEAKKQQGVSTTNRKERGAVEFVILEKGAVKNLTPVERSALATRIEATHKNAAESIAALRGEAATDGPSDVIEHPKTYISSADLDEALRGTRPSVSEQEKMRLQRIYDSFLGGKPAEASVGQRATMA